jgi:dUTP pyrophosphatase
VQLKVAKTCGDADLPVYATAGSIAFDMTAVIDPDLHKDGLVEIRPGEAVTIGTGLAFELPPGSGLFLFSRSGHGIKQRMRLGNCVGLIDSDYRGEVMVNVTNDGRRVQRIKHGERIAQGVVLPVPRVAFTLVTDPGKLSQTERGAGGFGSTGK